MKKLLIITLMCFMCLNTIAQNNFEGNSKKVGLVLSGGGAKGFAHIGVLKVIDSLGIKVDYIAGTSMGAIVGSLYASGYSGKQLDSIFKSLDFDAVISDDIPRAAKTFYERDNTEKYAVSLPFDKFKLKLPSALSRGQNVFNLLSKLTLHVSEINDFEKLPIPFFCVATNVENGKAVILDSGNLAQAITASGAFPSLFQPVIIDDKLLIDGGVINNYPIDELKAKGMDIIIGVDVQDGLRDRSELKSAPDVLLQINNFRTINDMKQKSLKTDIYIRPDITDFTVVSFSEGEKIVENGVQAALAKIDELLPLKTIKSENLKTQVNIVTADSIQINEIDIEGNKRYTRSYVLGKLKLKGDSKVSYDDFNRGINNLIATNNFDTFQYQFKKSKDKDGYDLFANLVENEITTFLKLGLHYDDLYKSAALVNFTKKRLLFDNDVASLDIILGDNVRYNFEYLIDKGFYWSIGFKSRYNQFHKGINVQLLIDDSPVIGSGLNKIDVELQDQTNQFYLQSLFRRDFAFSIGAEHKRLKIKSETITLNSETDEFIFENTDYGSLFGTLKLDTYNNKYFPKRGLYFCGDFHWYLLASGFNDDFEPFSIAKADMGYAFSVSDKLAFNLKTEGGFKIGEGTTNTLDFALGGYGNDFINNFIPFYGYDFISLTGNSYVKATASADYEIFKKHHITLEGNWANVDDNIFESGEWFTLPDYRGYALGYGVETFLGPLQAKFSYSPEQRKSIWYFNIGFWF
ncbi:patatin-like phospholipase family protein [uncultured Psychroserpens sp.]|uniref:patatin-like phospholipase family protein n=1 Tax=uncultured Psychroserpens sp. TaxID=255436 RepID=UPI00261474BF|nr:patatin-like phospholipase family protein [uncultured Psychroserpens sp.]